MRAAAPALGQHTDQVLRDLLGLSPEEIAALSAAGVIRSKVAEKKP